MSYVIRPAHPDDAEAITRLTNHFILHTTIHFGLEPQSPQTTADAIAAAAASGHPWRVAERAPGSFAGYAKSASWRSRAAYRFTAETACYVELSEHRRGVGRRLYEALLEALAQAGFHRAVAGVTQPNPASDALHRAVGFRHVGTFSEVGFKQGAWRDVAWFERGLEADAPHRGCDTD